LSPCLLVSPSEKMLSLLLKREERDRRSEKYNWKTEIDLNANVNVNLTGMEVTRLLDNSLQDIDFSVVEEEG